MAFIAETAPEIEVLCDICGAKFTLCLHRERGSELSKIFPKWEDVSIRLSCHTDRERKRSEDGYMILSEETGFFQIDHACDNCRVVLFKMFLHNLEEIKKNGLLSVIESPKVM